MRKQRGLSLIGLLITSAVIVFFCLVGFKLLPSYIEYWTIQRIVSDLGRSAELRGTSIVSVQNAFDRRATIDSVTSVRGKDLEVNKVGDGFEIAANWSTRVPLFGNINACLDFEVKN
jgi:uncharacterized protein DUF4845